jgi:hypothetical protein
VAFSVNERSTDNSREEWADAKRIEYREFHVVGAAI